MYIKVWVLFIYIIRRLQLVMNVILDILQLYISIYSVMFVVDLAAGADVDHTASETHRRCNPLWEEAQAIPEGHEWWER